MSTMEDVSEFGRSGGQVPHEPLSTSEHFKELEEDVRHDREADRVAEGFVESSVVDVLVEAVALTI